MNNQGGIKSTLMKGSPAPLGARPAADGVNFAVWAPDAWQVELCLFDAAGTLETERMALPACSDGVWHGFLPAASAGLVYAYRAHGPWAPQHGQRFNPAKLLLDPWATDVVGSYGRQGPGPQNDATLAAALDLFPGHHVSNPLRRDQRDNAAVALKARVSAPMPPVDAAERPAIGWQDCVIYEAHVRSLSMRHPAIPPQIRGSYAALGHPAVVQHLQSIGVTTLSLLPVHFRADERGTQERGLSNHWGYSSIAFLAAESRYWSGRAGTSPASELREAIATLHAHGIEVILDVVYNHTAELEEIGPTLSMRGLANAHYYHLRRDKPAHYENWTGCGNALNLSQARVVELVLGSLRHWAEHYGVDGFRFDLATTLGRGRNGEFDNRNGFFAALQSDPLLSGLKLIAEPWDIGYGGYQLGGFPAGWREWNDKYRDNTRSWWLRGNGTRGSFVRHFAGSAEQFNHSARHATASINFITAHDGFTLRDLVSYEHKHNKANGENNRDGHSHNNSWNCGIEGDSDDAQILQLRGTLQRSLLTTLLCSVGVPMLLSGDELGHSQQGNNNAYCQDNEISWLDWENADQTLLGFVQQLAGLRQRYAALRQRDWLRGPETDPDNWSVRWLHPHGHDLKESEWHHEKDNALAIHLRASAGVPRSGENADLLICINRCATPVQFGLPDGDWSKVLDSSTPGEISDNLGERHCSVAARSVSILVHTT